MKTQKIEDLYHQVSVSYDGTHFAPYSSHMFFPLMRSFRNQSVRYWAIYGDIGGKLPNGDTFITERVMLVCSKEYVKMSDIYLHYGECPKCGQACQPEYENINNPDLEYVVCCDCRIVWNLHHEDKTDKRDGTEPWRKYRIDGIETFEQFGITPYECL